MILFFKLNLFLGYPDGRGSSHQQQVSCYGYKVRFFPMKMLAKVLFTHCYTLVVRGKSIKPKILPCVTMGE